MRQAGNGGRFTPPDTSAMNRMEILEEDMQKISAIIESSLPLSECAKHNGVTANSEAKQVTETSKMGSSSSADAHAPRFERMMGELWEALTAHWGNAFTSRHGDVWQAEPTWQSEMRGLTRNQILAGLEVCKYDARFAEWPPAARVFRAIAVRQSLRAGGASAEAVWRNVCDFYAQSRPAEAVWIIRKADSWEALRKGTDTAEREFYRLWHEMLAFVAGGGQLPPAAEPAPRIEYKRERKPVNWAAIREALGGAA